MHKHILTLLSSYIINNFLKYLINTAKIGTK